MLSPDLINPDWPKRTDDRAATLARHAEAEAVWLALADAGDQTIILGAYYSASSAQAAASTHAGAALAWSAAGGGALEAELGGVTYQVLELHPKG